MAFCHEARPPIRLYLFSRTNLMSGGLLFGASERNIVINPLIKLAMKQIVHWLARMFAMLLVLSLGASVQNANAQVLEEGYYYINSTQYSGQGLFYGTTGTTDRVQAAQHDAGATVTEADLPFVFHITLAEDGEHYNVQNFVSKTYWGRFADAADNSPGGGFGFVSSPEPFTIGEYGIGYYFDYAGERYPGYGGVVHAQDDGYCGFWGDTGNLYAHKIWELVPVDTNSLFHPEDVVEIEGNTPDGYYYINFFASSDPTTCMVPVNSEMLWRLGAYPREDADFDETYVWHITKNADGETYSIKNCGAQDFTYIENVSKGDHESPYVLMTGTNPAKFKFKYYSDGSIYIYSTDNDYNYGINTADGNIRTVNAQNTNSAVKFVEVPADKITNALKLQEAISNAAGRQFTVGTNPGQVSEEDYAAWETVYNKATAAAGSEDDNSALIAELNDATNTLISKIIPVSEGYYTFENGATEGEYLKPYFKNNEWYLGHDMVDPTLDQSAIWHVIKNADGNLVLKNCGTQDSTYVISMSTGYVWGLPRMAGTSNNYQTFKQEYSNVFKLYSSDNNNFWSADGGNVVSSNNDYHPKDGVWKIVKVDAPYFTELNEAITDAAGVVKDSKVGPDPGDNQGDATALNAAVEEARTMYDEASATDDEVNQMIAKLQEETEKFQQQDHSMRGIDDGYYYFQSYRTSFQASEPGFLAIQLTQDTYLKWRAINKKDPKYVFKVTSLGNGEYSIENMLYARYIDKSDASGIATTNTQTTPQTFTYSGADGLWYIKNTTDNKPYSIRTYETELSGSIETNDGSNALNKWYLKKITDQNLIDSLLNVSKQTRTTEAMTVALQKAEPACKAVYTYDVDHDNELITEVNETNPRDGQIWGSQVNDTYTSYANLIDKNSDGSYNLNSCFQSSWDASAYPNGRQPLQVDLRNNPVQNFEFYFGLRNNDWGWKECWSDIDVYATNDANVAGKDDLTESEWTHVGNYTDLTSYIKPADANINSTGRYFYYRITGLDQPYRFIRFIVNSTIDPQAAMMYTIGAFQMYDVVLNEENSPYNYIEGLKELVDQLNEEIAKGKESVANNNATEEAVAKIIELTKKIVALTPDTDPLDEKLAEVKAYVNKYSDEDNWGDVTSEQLETMLDVIGEAEEYDHDQPQQADLDARLAKLNAAFALYKTQQKKPETGVWYYISNTDKSRPGYTEEGGTGDIWSRWCNNNVIMAPHTNVTRDESYTEKDYVTWSGYDHLSQTLSDSVPADPYSMWRLVKIEGNDAEDVYALQSRATGHYLGVTSNHNGAAGMSKTPVPYKFNLLKSGQFHIICQDASNTWSTPLHADGRKLLLSWESGEDSPSTWTLEPIDTDDIYYGELTVRNNSAMILTLPYAYNDETVADLNKENDVMTYAVKGLSDDANKLLLTKKTTFEAGEPMVVIVGDPATYADADEGVRIFLPLADEFSYDVKAANGLVGTFTYSTVPLNVGLLKGDSVISNTNQAAKLYGQRGYVNVGGVTNYDDMSTDAVLYLNGEFVNNINVVPTNGTNGKVDVYTTDGVLVKKNVKAENATDGLKKGVYIIGKEKVLVK